MKITIDEIAKKSKNRITILVISFIIILLLYFFSEYIYKIWIIEEFHIIIFLTFIIAFFIFLFEILDIRKLKNCDILKNELNDILVYCDSTLLTQNYVIPSLNIKYLFKYDDIILIYKRYQLANGGGINQYLVIVQKTGKKVEFLISTTKICSEFGEPKDFSNILLEKNPNILVGKTKENKKILYEQYGIKL